MNQIDQNKSESGPTEIAIERKRLRNFGFTVGIAMLVLGALLFWKEKSSWPYFSVVGGLFVLLGALAPSLLRSIERVWMKVALIMGWVMTRVILGILFVLIFSPAGLIIRLLGKDPMRLRIDRDKSSYWQKRDSASSVPERLERMF